MTEIRRRGADGVRPGDTFTVRRAFSADEVEAFTRLSRDRNPVHHDPVFAEAGGLAAPICHGLLVATLLTEVGGEVGFLAGSIQLRFRAPVHPGETVTCRVTFDTVDERGRATFQAVITNQSGVEVLQATGTGRLPGAATRQRLAALLEEEESAR